jgi:four helix bundle protein
MSFQKLRVYQAAELLDQLISELLPRVQGHEKDVNQLKRAAPSVAYNIAEAFGSEHSGQKINHLGIARGSVDEPRAILRKLAKSGSLSPDEISRPSVLAVTIAKMLTAWIERLQQQ